VILSDKYSSSTFHENNLNHLEAVIHKNKRNAADNSGKILHPWFWVFRELLGNDGYRQKTHEAISWRSVFKSMNKNLKKLKNAESIVVNVGKCHDTYTPKNFRPSFLRIFSQVKLLHRMPKIRGKQTLENPKQHISY